MRITGPKRRIAAASIRGCVALTLFAAGVVQAADSTPFTSVAKLATALSENDADGALELFDPQMKSYGEIEQKIEALAAQSDVSCAIDIVMDTETDGVHKLDLDWLMTLKPLTDDAGKSERRRERIQVEMRQLKGVWKITSISPLSIFDAIHLH